MHSYQTFYAILIIGIAALPQLLAVAIDTLGNARRHSPQTR